jgi:hypothetical protein
MMNKGATEEQIEKEFQVRFNIQWAWADSVATEIKQKFEQLTTARKNQIADITARIKSATKYCKEEITLLEKLFKKPVPKSKRNWIERQLLDIRSKIRRIANLNRKRQQLEGKKWLSIVFGSKKLFKAQYNLETNGYKNHQEWLEDWKKVRSGNFYSVGKGSAVGGNPVARVLVWLESSC